jgi:hypothetical protein
MLFVYFYKTEVVYMVLFAICCFFFTIDGRRRPIQIGVMCLHTSLTPLLVFALKQYSISFPDESRKLAGDFSLGLISINSALDIDLSADSSDQAFIFINFLALLLEVEEED